MAEYYSNEPDNRRNGDEGTLPLILGILSIVFAFTFSRVLGFILGIIAIVKGNQYRFLDNDAKVGFICGIVGVCISSIALMFIFFFFSLFIWI